MDIYHEWELEKYGKFDGNTQTGWIAYEQPESKPTFKILSSCKVVICSNNTVLVSP